jgi:hypothetical protein
MYWHGEGIECMYRNKYGIKTVYVVRMLGGNTCPMTKVAPLCDWIVALKRAVFVPEKGKCGPKKDRCGLRRGQFRD